MGKGLLEDNKQKMMLVAGSLVVILFFGSLIVYIYNQNKNGQTIGNNEPLLVHASDGPTKIEPKDKGGLDVPNQDRVVFDAVTGEDSQTGENVRTGPQQPLKRPTEGAGGTNNVNDAQLSSEDTAGINTTATTPQTQQEITPAQNQPDTQPQTQAPAAIPQTPDFTGKYMVQLGAFGNQIAAQNAWDAISQRFGTALNGMVAIYEGVQRGGATTLYRLRAGPIDSRIEADSVCDRLKASNQACFVVTP
jgi:cell division protein FtsN